MLSIGDLAQATGVSARRLRHYDALGLIVPEAVDAATGNRWYGRSQLGRVDALLVLKDLGFTLAQCRDLLDERTSLHDVRELLHRREAALHQGIQADLRRLDDLRDRLRSIERSLDMAHETLELAPLPALRLAQVTELVNDVTEIATVLPGLLDRLAGHLPATGGSGPVRRINTYYGRPDGSKIEVSVGVVLPDGAPAAVGGSSPAAVGGSSPAAVGGQGLDVVDVPAEPHGASMTFTGPLSGVGDAWATMDVALEPYGLRPHGLHRQVFVSEDPATRTCVLQLQYPVRPHPE